MLLLPEQATDAGDFSFGLTAGWLGLCGELAAGERATVAICGNVLAGAVHAVVFQLEPTTPGDRPWAGAGLSARAEIRLAGPFVLDLGVEGVAPLTRPRFFVENHADTVFQEPVVGGIAFGGLGLSFL